MRSKRWVVAAALACGCSYEWDALRFNPDAALDRSPPVDAVADARPDRVSPDVADARDVTDVADARDAADGMDARDAADAPLDAPADLAAEMPADAARDATPDAVADAMPDAMPDVVADAMPDAAPDMPPVCTPMGMTCPCAVGNPGGYCRPGEACTGGSCARGTPAGSLVITEIMNDPAAVGDEMGEWVEIHNRGTTPLDLRGLRISNNRMQSTTLAAGAAPILIAPGGYAVLARNAVAGVTPLWVYGVGLATNTLTFSNSPSGDAVILDLGTAATEIDRVAYSEAAMWPYTSGRTKSLRATALNAMANDQPTSWCNAPTQWMGAGDYGSPGAANPPCP